MLGGGESRGIWSRLESILFIVVRSVPYGADVLTHNSEAFSWPIAYSNINHKIKTRLTSFQP